MEFYFSRMKKLFHAGKLIIHKIMELLGAFGIHLVQPPFSSSSAINDCLNHLGQMVVLCDNLSP